MHIDGKSATRAGANSCSTSKRVKVRNSLAQNFALAAYNRKPKTELLQKFDNLYNRKVDIFSRNDTILIVL